MYQSKHVAFLDIRVVNFYLVLQKESWPILDYTYLLRKKSI